MNNPRNDRYLPKVKDQFKTLKKFGLPPASPLDTKTLNLAFNQTMYVTKVIKGNEANIATSREIKVTEVLFFERFKNATDKNAPAK